MKQPNWYVFLVILLVGFKIQGQTVPENKDKFFEEIARHQHAVVHYINYDQVGDDKVKQQALEAMKSAFRASAHESAHVLAGIRFIGINSRIAPELIKLYNLDDDFSAVLLFKDGQVLKDKDGKLITLTGGFNQNDLGVFIQKYFGDYIGYQVQQAQAQRAAQPGGTVTRVVERPVYRYRTYPGYYRGFYRRPYYRSAGYWRRPYFGFGFGGRRGGVGFGFGF